MNTLAQDVKDLLVAAGYTFGGTSDWGLHVANEPDKPDRCITVYDNGGAAPRPYINPALKPTEYPTISIRARGMTFDEASGKAQELAVLLNTKGGFIAGGAHYGGLFQSSPVSPLKIDDHGRYVFVVDFRTVREQV